MSTLTRLSRKIQGTQFCAQRIFWEPKERSPQTKKECLRTLLFLTKYKCKSTFPQIAQQQLIVSSYGCSFQSDAAMVRSAAAYAKRVYTTQSLLHPTFVALCVL